jgi:hypothetical protein
MDHPYGKPDSFTSPQDTEDNTMGYNVGYQDGLRNKPAQYTAESLKHPYSLGYIEGYSAGLKKAI